MPNPTQIVPLFGHNRLDVVEQRVDPPMRKLAELLEAHGFHVLFAFGPQPPTTQPARPAHLLAAVDGDALQREAERLRQLLEDFGVEVGDLGAPEGARAEIVASYDPSSQNAWIEVRNAGDASLALKVAKGAAP